MIILTALPTGVESNVATIGYGLAGLAVLAVVAVVFVAIRAFRPRKADQDAKPID